MRGEQCHECGLSCWLFRRSPKTSFVVLEGDGDADDIDFRRVVEEAGL